MQSVQKRSLVLLAIGVCLSSPATAAPIGELFSFTQTSSTPPGAVIASGELILSQSAFANGVSIDRFFLNGGGNPPNLSGTGILSINFSALDTDHNFLLNTTYNDFRAFPVDAHTSWTVDLVSGPSGVPTGRVDYNDGASDFTFNLGDPTSHGGANTDISSICDITGTCLFTGDWQLVGAVVPEPTGLAIFGIGLAGLFLLHRRKATNAVSG